MKTHNTILLLVAMHIYNACICQPVGPLVNTKWGQEGFYNDQCPKTNGNSCFQDSEVPAGCVAIALAQIMKFHGHPSNGVGSNAYIIEAQKSGLCNMPKTSISAAFNLTYNWGNMPDILTKTSTTTQKTEVARIIYNSGVAPFMQYGIDGSGSNWNNAWNSLLAHFNYYNNSLNIIHKKDKNNTEWNNILKSELDAKRVIYYRGTRDKSGHAWVCDGYRTINGKLEFHMNWGWNGKQNGYFDIHSTTFLYPLNQTIIIGISPKAYSPTSVTASNGTFGDKVSISWDGTTGDYFRVYRSTSNTFSSASALGSGWQTSKSFDDLTALTNTTYYYWVKAASNSTGTNHTSAFSSPSSIGKKVAASLSLNKTSISATSVKGSNTVSVTSNVSWLALSDKTWCTISTPSGSGNGTITFSYTANTGITREATVKVRGGALEKSFKITQSVSGRNIEIVEVELTEKILLLNSDILITPNHLNNYDIHISDIMGRKIYSELRCNDTKSIPIDIMPKGLIIVSIKRNETINSTKLFIH